ncbi:MAG: hypothetical protein HYX84_02555 [Chloroflexi bacterium]|nr:hypothetical protein [Chloroflexota bacterium]
MPQTMDHIQMLKDEDRWPRWPVLPMIRRRDGECGLVVAGRGPTIYLANLFQLDKLPSAEKISFASYEDMVDAGWEVD